MYNLLKSRQKTLTTLTDFFFPSSFGRTETWTQLDRMSTLRMTALAFCPGVRLTPGKQADTLTGGAIDAVRR